MTKIQPKPEISVDAKKEALDRILGSPILDQRERLRDFLAYILEEELAGRGDEIRGKTIAQDVYHRTSGDGDDPENIVRVDARRLRQRLDHYYATIGAEDPVRLQLDPGSYRPRFEEMNVSDIRPETPSLPWKVIFARSPAYLGLFVLGAVVGVGLTTTLAPKTPDQFGGPNSQEAGKQVAATADNKTAQRTAVLGKSPASLEAINLADQAQRMIFPIFDLPRQELLTSVFERVVELDPDYFGGYAGLSFVLGTRALLSPDPESRADLVARSREMADSALRLAPTQAWTQSALAWVSFSEKDYVEAMRLAELAGQLDPENGQILDILGSIALFSGDFERAIAATNDGQARVGSLQRFANRNIFAAASYHLGNYRDSYEGFENAAAAGDPLSAPSLAYQAAAFAAVGRETDALRKLDELNRAWPSAPLEAMLYGIHREKADADAVLDRLRSLGWSGRKVDTSASSSLRHEQP
ncbi:hypothetical protein R5H32_20360 [Defluviimonas sp. D31]|uniref:tetratricopeptide repeat protein n=1 Tax=Defluviimonas sp. D31 TaxID=3083253 RepID=UPI00296F3CFD|nr:hypothetical protein [Defluviimonas sp. D31]MDW4551690.1 hypothetical protein [Defluviimonas sp. D31]